MPQANRKQGAETGQKKKKKGRAPAHQNSYAFQHNPKSKKTEKILSSPNVGVCRRCHEKIEWRKKYRKYKPLTQPSKCNLCKMRKVKAAYHTICTDCSFSEKARKALPSAETSPTYINSEGPEHQPESEPVIDEEPYEDQRQVCSICVKKFAISGEDRGDLSSLVEKELSGTAGRLSLREKKAVERKIQRRLDEVKAAAKIARREERKAEEEGGNYGDGDDSTRASERGEEEYISGAEDIDDNVSDDDDLFLKATGGQALTGKAYQKKILEKEQNTS